MSDPLTDQPEAPAGAEEVSVLSSQDAQRIRITMALEVRSFQKSADHWSGRGDRLASAQARSNQRMAQLALDRFNVLFKPSREEIQGVKVALDKADQDAAAAKLPKSKPK